MGGVDLVALAPVLRRFENSNGEISDFQLPAEDGNLVKLRPGN